MTLKELRYRYIYDVTAFFIGEIRGDFNDKEEELLVARIKSEFPRISDIKLTFDESIWYPDQPDLYGDLILFHVKLVNYSDYLRFFMRLSKGKNQEPFSIT
jgi:hypothetical protein